MESFVPSLPWGKIHQSPPHQNHMIRLFYINASGEIKWEKRPANLEPSEAGRVVWVDLQSSTAAEKRQVESHFDVELFTPQEASEIESSSRYYEDESCIEANNGFIAYEARSYKTDQVSFILRKDILFTIRDADLRSFALTVRRMKVYRTSGFVHAIQILLTIIEHQIDLDADFIETISKSTTDISRKLTKERSFKEDTLLDIAELQENTILARESIVDKQRLVSSLLKSTKVEGDERDRFRIIMKDISSILQHIEFGFERLEYLQNTFLGLVDLEQNKVIKIFTVVTVVFMPPTLIASIYGMNFAHMPEVGWRMGYPLAILLMIVSSLLFLWYFKRKKWL
jgi:magnesium transporter